MSKLTPASLLLVVLAGCVAEDAGDAPVPTKPQTAEEAATLMSTSFFRPSRTATRWSTA
jgi:hypothetical protein